MTDLFSRHCREILTWMRVNSSKINNINSSSNSKLRMEKSISMAMVVIWTSTSSVSYSSHHSVHMLSSKVGPPPTASIGPSSTMRWSIRIYHLRSGSESKREKIDGRSENQRYSFSHVHLILMPNHA
jgi:hypothetical protein